MSTVQLNLETDDVVLPPARTEGGATLASALRLRRSTREFLPDALSLQEVSDLLWAAFGVNRPPRQGRTAPSAHDWQEIAVFAVLPEGAFRYDPQAHRLSLVKAEDLRGFTGLQAFAASAPLDLVYVADFAAMHDVRADERPFLAGADAGCIAQNVYLHCAAHGLGTVVRALIDRRRLAQALGLQPTERIALAQSVGRCATRGGVRKGVPRSAARRSMRRWCSSISWRHSSGVLAARICDRCCARSSLLIIDQPGV